MNLSEKQIQELKENKISIEDLSDEYFISFQCIFEFNNTLKLLNENICSFKEIVDKFKSIKDHDNSSSLYRLLKNKGLLRELIENKKLTSEDLRYLLNKIDKTYELDQLSENTSLLKYIANKVLFKELIDKFKSIKNCAANEQCLRYLLRNKEFFKELIEDKKLSKEDLRYLLNTIDNTDELDKLCWYISLIKEILNEFVLNKENVDKFNTMIENNKWCKDRNIHTLFEMIEYRNKNNEEVLKLNELNRKICLLSSFDLNEDERLELIEVLKNNEIARNRLIQIIDNNLEDQYDFGQLKNILTKDNDKKLKTKFNF